MKAMIIRSYGAADVFAPAELPRPEAGPGQLLVRVAATSVNPADAKARELGQVLDFTPPLPAVLGMDFAGWVEAVGAGVTGFSPGDEVFGCAGGVVGHGGALAEYIAADARLVAPKPRSLTMAEAAALPLVSITAWEALFDRMRIEAGQRVLIQGGAGGVGHVAVQIARAKGAEVYATAGDPAKLALVERLGAIPIDYRAEAPEAYVARLTDGRGFDAVFDTVGGENILTSFRAARLMGQVATTVSICTLDLTLAHVRGLTLHVVYMLIPMIHGVGRERHGEILREVAALADAGELQPVIDQRLPLARVTEAHRRLESGQAIGKVIVEVAQPIALADAAE